MASRKAILTDQLVLCGLSKRQSSQLASKYEFTLAPVIRKSAIQSGINLPPLEPPDLLDYYAATQDEAALERALDDISTRRKAAALLENMPQSRFIERMKERALPRVRINGRSLEADCVGSVSKDMIRDGLPEPGSTISVVDQWTYLFQLIKVIPASVWECHLTMKAKELLSLQTDKWIKGSVVEGWRHAAAMHREEQWLELFCLYTEFDGGLSATIQKLEADCGMRERLLVKVFERNGGNLRMPLESKSTLYALHACRHDWSESFSRQVLPLLIQEASYLKSTGDFSFDFVLQNCGSYFCITLLAEAEGKLQPYLAVPAVEEFLNALRLKSKLYSVLNLHKPVAPME